jgi:hypothetical protein
MNNCRRILVVSALLLMAGAAFEAVQAEERPPAAPNRTYAGAYKARPRVAVPAVPGPACTLLTCLTVVGVGP